MILTLLSLVLLPIHLPSFLKLKLLTIFDIYKLQLGKLIFESVNNIGPSRSVIQFLLATDVHDHNTRYANEGNFYFNSVRTVKYGLKGLQIEGLKLWTAIPNNIKDSRSIKSFNANLKKFLINLYG